MVVQTIEVLNKSSIKFNLKLQTLAARKVIMALKVKTWLRKYYYTFYFTQNNLKSRINKAIKFQMNHSLKKYCK